MINLKQYNIPYSIISFSISNETSEDVYVTVYIVDKDGNQYAITALDYLLKPNQAYIRDTIINLNPYDYIKINSTDVIDFYFSIQ